MLKPLGSRDKKLEPFSQSDVALIVCSEKDWLKGTRFVIEYSTKSQSLCETRLDVQPPHLAHQIEATPTIFEEENILQINNYQMNEKKVTDMAVFVSEGGRSRSSSPCAATQTNADDAIVCANSGEKRHKGGIMRLGF